MLRPLVLIGGRLAWALRLLREPSHRYYRAGLWALVTDQTFFCVSAAVRKGRNVQSWDIQIFPCGVQIRRPVMSSRACSSDTAASSVAVSTHVSRVEVTESSAHVVHGSLVVRGADYDVRSGGSGGSHCEADKSKSR